MLLAYGRGSQCPDCYREYTDNEANVKPGQPCPALECDSRHSSECNRTAKSEDDTCVCDVARGLSRTERVA